MGTKPSAPRARRFDQLATSPLVALTSFLSLEQILAGLGCLLAGAASGAERSDRLQRRRALGLHLAAASRAFHLTLSPIVRPHPKDAEASSQCRRTSTQV
ncbi:unnamed protein product [Prorocentrum cordatum]|uniref:Peroxisomal membrane protein PEX16 n=1 Tax=Prorocentrum cordatum TaxID=2364126 RepID=A0ABN9VCW1_9DINO|nr:unnamed protein product [Polarella glacialis]